jgi:hypothetical protein
MRTAWVYAVQKEEGGSKVWHMTEIELTEDEYRKFFEDDEPKSEELHTLHISSNGSNITWECSCTTKGVAFTTSAATANHRKHKHEELGYE